MEKDLVLGTIALFFMHLYITKMYINRLLYIWYDSIFDVKESIIRTVFNTVLALIAIFITLKYIPYYHPTNIIIRISVIVIIILLIIWYYKKEKNEITHFK